ncbi:MAG: serine hydrolase [Syntrophales bacterium LBB04]|nr:serine hydrolase [Syntrophales bacterium LBB04]
MSTGGLSKARFGFGLAVVTRRVDLAGSVGTFGWDGGLGTSWYSDPREDLVGILMTSGPGLPPAPRQSVLTSGPRPTRPSTTEAFQRNNERCYAQWGK